ncbi:hypothetical protein ACHAWF_019012 [Thalassiosira exigua]
MNLSSAVALLSAGAPLGAHAFAPSPGHRRRASKPRSTRLDLLPDPATAAAAIDSSSALVSSGFVESLGSLALLGSVGVGVAYSNAQNKDWSYEYKFGNEYSAESAAGDLALLEEDPASVSEKAEEATAKEPVAVAADVPPARRSMWRKKAEEATVKEPVAVADDVPPAPVVEPAKPKPAAPKPAAPPPAKASAPSKELLESAEKAKAEVQKVGVRETKEKMEAKASAPEPAAVANRGAPKEEPPSTEVMVAEEQKPGRKRRLAKGLSLVLAAGAVAAARNVIKAYLGRGMV